VLWIALETPGSCVILDEGPGRRIASQLGIAFTGTLGLLLDAKKLGLITSLTTVLNELHRHNFRMSPRLRQMILKAAGECP
jgi:predicted nucleic acid-binding protein